MITRFKRWWYRKEIAEWKRLTLLHRLNAATEDQIVDLYRATRYLYHREIITFIDHENGRTTFTLRRNYDV